jgi:hypothetical protein
MLIHPHGPRGLVAPAAVALFFAACSKEMVRPRSAGEPLSDRPERALVVGQFKVVSHGLADADIAVSAPRLVAGKDTATFADLVPDNGAVFMLWVLPGTFCFGQPTHGQPPALLGRAPCAQVPAGGKAYYLGSVTWHVKKGPKGPEAELEVKDSSESVAANKSLMGIYLEHALVAEEAGADQAPAGPAASAAPAAPSRSSAPAKPDPAAPPNEAP